MQMKNVGGRNEISFTNSHLAKVPFKKSIIQDTELNYPSLLCHVLEEQLAEGSRDKRNCPLSVSPPFNLYRFGYY